MFWHALNKKERKSANAYWNNYKKKHESYGNTQQEHSHDTEYARHDRFNTRFALLKALKMYWDAKPQCISSCGALFAAKTLGNVTMRHFSNRKLHCCSSATRGKRVIYSKFSFKKYQS